MSEVIVINPTKQLKRDKQRVAAYVRVSSDSDDQENSFISQYDYYSNLIGKNPDWDYVDIYADKGISGTELTKRDDFNRMYEDCADGKIDLILTKSVSRFARNLYDCIDIVRKLKTLGTNIIFEKENINTSDMNNEVELATLATIAQEESMSISENVRMGIQFRMKNGTFSQCRAPYGYYSEGGILKINEEQATIVRIIFQEYLKGKSIKRIATELNSAGVKSISGGGIWRDNVVSYILKNVRYKGDALLQKTYNESFPFKKRINRGEKDMYYIKNSNPAIVSEELFDKANELLERKKASFCNIADENKDIFYQKIYCSECGTIYRKKKGTSENCWTCRKRDTSKKLCESHPIYDFVIRDGFVSVYNRLINNIENILTPLQMMLKEYKMNRMRSMGEIENINKEIASLTEQLLLQEKAKLAGFIETEMFQEQRNIITAKITKMKKDKKVLLGSDECEKALRKTDALISIIKMSGAMNEFDEQMFRKIVKRIRIDKDKNINYELINGLKLTINESEVI